MKFLIAVFVSVVSASFLMGSVRHGSFTVSNEKDRSGKLVKCEVCGNYYNQGTYHNCSKK